MACTDCLASSPLAGVKSSRISSTGFSLIPTGASSKPLNVVEQPNGKRLQSAQSWLDLFRTQRHSRNGRCYALARFMSSSLSRYCSCWTTPQETSTIFLSDDHRHVGIVGANDVGIVSGREAHPLSTRFVRVVSVLLTCQRASEGTPTLP